MFISQAHSFRQQARLAVTLAWIGGYTNILTVLICGTVTSHVSGTTSSFGHDLFSARWKLAGFALYLIFTFFIGAAVSGFCTEIGRRRNWNSIYVLPIILEAALLACFAVGIEFVDPATFGKHYAHLILIGLASGAMGLQNATITRISGGIVRTTHVTGVLTDLGLETTQFLLWLFDRNRNYPPAPARPLLHSTFHHPTARRLALLASIIASFALGAGLGTLAFNHFPRFSMFPPVIFLLWLIYQDITVPIAEIEASSLISSSPGSANPLDLPAGLAVYHLRKNQNRKSQVHRMPNLLDWSDHLPEKVRVVILDLAHASQFNSNAILEIKALLQRFENQNRQLILSGITPAQFSQLQLASHALSIDNVCPDLELAIARGFNLLEHPDVYPEI